MSTGSRFVTLYSLRMLRRITDNVIVISFSDRSPLDAIRTHCISRVCFVNDVYSQLERDWDNQLDLATCTTLRLRLLNRCVISSVITPSMTLDISGWLVSKHLCVVVWLANSVV